MENPQHGGREGNIVTIRRQRWRVLDVTDYGVHRLILAGGIGPSNFGVVRPFITPFDLIRPEKQRAGIRHISTRRWRRGIRALLAAATPPGALPTVARARLDILPHQLEPALAVTRGMATRLLLADDVGLGKTIQAGIVLAELRDRAAAARVLILAPAGLREQWCAELAGRFGIDATVVDTAVLRRTVAMFPAGLNPWAAMDTVVASIDLVKRPEHLVHVLATTWDLLIVDEAHGTAADSERHEAVERIASRTSYILLLTATPHSGSRSEFAALCGTGAQGDDVVMFRRSRDIVQDAARRRVHRLPIRSTAAEQKMHAALAALTGAIRREHDESNRDVWLALAVLNKRSLSSAWSLAQSLARRMSSLDRQGVGAWQPSLFDMDGEQADADRPTEWQGGFVLSDAGRERRLLRSTLDAAVAACAAGESKLAAVRRLLRRIDEPAIVFTEYRDTLQHFAQALPMPTLQLHGGLSAAERRTVLDAFTRSGGVLLATDAAAEGLNLQQRCRLVVHLELPWSPTRLEQRIGRVDRLGQRRTVHAIALVGAATAEERVLDRLRQRIARARADAGAADPLDGERDIERLVVDGSTPEIEPAHETPFAAPVVHLDLASEAAREAARLRSCVSAPNGDWSTDHIVAVGHARHRNTRRHLAGGVLAVVELRLLDGCGRIARRDVLPLIVDAGSERTRPNGGERAIVELIETAIERGLIPDVVRWKRSALELFEAFCAAGIQRERAIAAAATDGNAAALFQAGLFDRRAERGRAAMAAATAGAIDAASARLALIERVRQNPTVTARVSFLLLPR